MNELLKRVLKCEHPEVNNAEQFAAIRAKLRELGGAPALLQELEGLGFVADEKLTTDTKPFNVFARIMSGELVQPGMETEMEALGDASTRFMIACNRPENDEHWSNAEAEWVGKASMSKRHRFLLTRDLSWKWFNVLAFGLDPKDLNEAIRTLLDMKTTAKSWASKMPNWSNNIGLYFHVYGHASVNALHLHIVDLEVTGPTLNFLNYKNLPIDAVITVLEDELANPVSFSPSQPLRGSNTNTLGTILVSKKSKRRQSKKKKKI